MDHDLVIETSNDAAAVAWENAMVGIDDQGAGFHFLARTLAAGLNGVRCAILATISEETQGDLLDIWARVELFGHTVRYGHVTEIKIGGKQFLAVVEPTLVHGEDGDEDAAVTPAVRRLYHPNAIYGMSPLTKSEVIATLRRQKGLSPLVPASDDIPF